MIVDRHTQSSAMSPPSVVRDCCAHCGDPVPSGQINPSAEHQFCCNGCRAVFEVIRSCGLDRYYAIKAGNDANPSPAKISNRKFGEMDDPTFRRLYVQEVGEGLATVELFLPTVHCAACVWLIERLPRICPGVIEARLDLRRALVRITWHESRTALSAIARSLDSLGYAPTPARSVRMREARRAEDRRQLIRVGVAGACAGNVMLLALALYAGMFDAIEAPYLHMFRVLSMVIGLVAIAWPGRIFFIGALSALRTKTLHLDLPIAVGLGAGAVWSVFSTFRETGEVYFDSLSVLVFALLVGRSLQTRQQRRTADSLELLYALTPTSARVVSDVWATTAVEVPIEAVLPGMIVEVRAGDSVPVDGIILRGSSNVDQSLLTGESRPVSVQEGMGVAAGAVNLSSTIRVRVDAIGEATRVGRLMSLVEEAASHHAPIVQMADRIAGWFVVAALLLASITFGIWLMIEPAHAVDHAVAMLIVTCPCALGLATPLAVTVAVGRAARRGMLVKGGDIFERLARPGVLFLDKTGTITTGRLSLVKWVGEEAVQPWVAALESHSTHPIALALARHQGASPHIAATNVTVTIGGGIEGDVDGRHIVVGSSGFVSRRVAKTCSEWERVQMKLAQHGLTPVWIAVDQRVVAIAGLGDPIRADSRASIAMLQSAGWEVQVLSGDQPEIVRRVGEVLGLPPSACHGGVEPEQKLAIVRDAMNDATRPVVMVGDGVNDSAALAAATVGIAVHAGAEASLAAADVCLHRPGLQPIVELVGSSRRVMRVIRRNLCASLFYNVVAATLAMTGVINPLIAAILMPVSSLSVVAISMRSRTFMNRSD